jgi:hypothetical protein
VDGMHRVSPPYCSLIGPHDSKRTSDESIPDGMGWDMKFVVGGAGKEKKKARGFADYLYSLCAGFIWLDDDEKMHNDDRTSTTTRTKCTTTFCTTGMD